MLLACLLLLTNSQTIWADPAGPLKGVKRVVFLGDSNTHAGMYIAILQAMLTEQHPDRPIEMINLGLPSETISGLSEPDHPFPRPDLHERLDRALDKSQPDLVVACYGMNDGIYYPLATSRFQKFQQGVETLISKVQQNHAKLVLLTPPPFDPLPMREQGKLLSDTAPKFAWFAIYENYDNVQKTYADWILSHKNVFRIVDIHTPINAYLKKRRETESDYKMSDDGVHFGIDGHRLIARELAPMFSLNPDVVPSPDLLDAVTKKQSILHAAWLTEVGHKRPGMKPGLALDEARRKADEINLTKGDDRAAFE